MGSGLHSCLGLRGWSWVRSGRLVRLGCQRSTAVVGMAYEADAFGRCEQSLSELDSRACMCVIVARLFTCIQAACC